MSTNRVATLPLLALCLTLFLSGSAGAQQWCPDGNCQPLPFNQQPLAQQSGVFVTPTAEHHRAVMRVGRGDAAGTGTLVAIENNCGYLFTAAHVVEGGGQCWVDYGRGQVAAQLLGADHGADVAALSVLNMPALPTVQIATGEECPRSGETAEVIGFGTIRQWNAQPRHLSAKVKGYINRDTRNNDQITLAFESISGDSGGPIIYGGKLVGVLWGGPTSAGHIYETHGACATRLQECAQRWRVPCPSGNCPTPVAKQPPAPAPKPVQPPLVAAPPPKPCTCDGSGNCKCDPKGDCKCDPASVCKCDGKLVAALKLKLMEAEIRIAALEAKPTPASPIHDVLVDIVRPNGTIQKLKYPLGVQSDGKTRTLKLNLFDKK